MLAPSTDNAPVTRDSVLALLAEFKRQHGEQYGVVALGLFGSVARNEMTANSDVDICVRTRTANPFNLVHMRNDLQQLLHRRVDVVRLWEQMNPLLRQQIAQEARFI